MLDIFHVFGKKTGKYGRLKKIYIHVEIMGKTSPIRMTLSTDGSVIYSASSLSNPFLS